MFITSYNPTQAAAELSDQLLMLTGMQCATIMSSAVWNNIVELNQPTPSRKELPDGPDLPPYRPNKNFRKEQFAQWAGIDQRHYTWVYLHYMAIVEELARRFPTRTPPKYASHADNFAKACTHIPRATDMYTEDQSKPADLAYPLRHKILPPEILKEAYNESDPRIGDRFVLTSRYLYVYARLHTWSKTAPPKWLIDRDMVNAMGPYFGVPHTQTAHSLNLANALITAQPGQIEGH